MGVHVVLDIVARRIDPEAWAEAFEETARLLVAHPARLLGYGFRFVAGVRVPVFTRSVAQGGQDPAERRWCVVGDRATLGTGERQRMYRDLRRYMVRAAPGLREPEGDILVLASHGGDAGAGAAGTARVFGEGAQSPSCQLALLAAAMVVEARFPRDALVSGRFDRDQAEVARRWAGGVLGRAVPLPVRLDGWRLVERLGKEGAAAVRPPEPAHAETAGPPAGSVPAIDALAALVSPGELSAAQREHVHALALVARRAGAAGEPLPGPPAAAVAAAVARGGPTLTEDAWDWIEREEDRDLQRFLACLAALAPAGAEDAALRRVLMENRALSRYAATYRGARP